MAEIRVKIAKNPTNEYPFAVVVDDGYELLCTSRRDCQIAVSGAHHALIAVGVPRSNVTWDEQITGGRAEGNQTALDILQREIRDKGLPWTEENVLRAAQRCVDELLKQERNT